MAQRKKEKATGAKKTKASDAAKYIREEMHELKKGGIKDQKQAVAIGLSRARRAGQNVAAPKKGTASEATRKRAQKDIQAGNKSVAKKATAKKATSQKKERT